MKLHGFIQIMKHLFLTLLKKGKVKIPKEIIEKCRLKNGDLIEISIEKIYLEDGSDFLLPRKD